MAKRKTTQKSAQRPPGEHSGTVSYSTRFNKPQREVIEAAAREKNWSPAKLIRVAAVSSASDIMNASGQAGFNLQKIAAVVVKQLLHPSIVLCDPAGDPVGHESIFEDGDGSILADRPSPAELSQISEALETSATTFIGMVLEHWRAIESESGSDVYKPKYRAAELLGGVDEIEPSSGGDES